MGTHSTFNKNFIAKSTIQLSEEVFFFTSQFFFCDGERCFISNNLFLIRPLRKC
jgi:hypothetical protein